jgi:RHS repeat-associated protein
MMPAAKHGDPQIGVDIHLCVVPPSPSPVPLPTPHMSIVFDPMDYLPFIGATVTVCGMKRAIAGTAGKAIHIPPGFPFAPKIPDTSDEIFMGSATVDADGNPFSFLAVPVLSCQVAGMPSPPRPKQHEKKLMMLPTVVNLAIPTNVFVGGPPTISLMGMAFKLGFAALGRFAKSGLFRRMRQKLFGWMKPGFLKCNIFRAEPVDIATGEVSVEQLDFTLPGPIPIEWVRTYRSNNTRKGACGYGWETPADVRLEVFPLDNSVAFLRPGVAPALFPELPAADGENGAVLELWDGALLSDHGGEFRVRTKEDRIYYFKKAEASTGGEGVREYPIHRISDLCGNWLEFERHGPDVITISESAGRRIEIETEDGLIQQMQLFVPDAEFRHLFVRYQYDDDANLVAVLDAIGNPYTFAYDNHYLIRHTDRNGLSFYYEFAKNGEAWRVVHSWGDGGLYNYHFEYLDELKERRITDSLGHVSLVKLDDRNLPISEIDPLGGVTIYEYDEVGRTTAVVDPAGRRTGYVYDERGNLLQLQQPDGSTCITSFDADNRPVQILDGNAAEWLQRFDIRGLLTAQSSPLGNTTTFAYDRFGMLVEVLDARNGSTRLSHDRYGQPRLCIDPMGCTARMEHGFLGELIGRCDGLERWTRFRYDAKGRIVGVQQPTGSTISVHYDANDRVIRHVDERGSVTTLTYFGISEVATRIEPDGSRIEYIYDTEERLAAVRNQRGEHHCFHRDALGRVVEELDYWGQRRRYGYDAGGALLWTEDALQQRILFNNDGLGRVVRKTMPHPAQGSQVWVETYGYDGLGHVTEAANPDVRLLRSFDPEGRLVCEVQAVTDGPDFRVENQYDAVGNRIRRIATVNGVASSSVEFTPDLSGLLAEVRFDGGEAARWQHDAAGQCITERLRDGLVLNRRYRSDGLLAEQVLQNAGRAVFAQRYRHDAGGLLTSQEDSDLGRNDFDHDLLGRIVEHMDPLGKIERYHFDVAGARLQTRATALGGREGELEGIHYRFDSAGRLVSEEGPVGQLALAWDAAHRLVASRKVEPPNADGVVVHYGYCPLGRRLFKKVNGASTWFGWDGDLLACEVVGNATRWHVHRPGGFEPLAMRADDEASWQYCIVLPNGQPESVVDLVTGERRAYQGPFALQGQYVDAETGLHYNRHRYFDPRTQAFISVDPLGLVGGIDVYAYAPNVLDWIDPFGLACRLSFSAWVKSKIGQGTHVYVAFVNNKAVYVGIARDVEERRLQHIAAGRGFDEVRQITSQPLNRAHARSVEQAIIDANPAFRNEINSISPTRALYNDAVRWGNNWLKANPF